MTFYYFVLLFEFKKGEEDCIMLILTRRVGETLLVGDDITLTVLAVKGNQVRIGVNAPKNVSICRQEIYEKLQNDDKKNK